MKRTAITLVIAGIPLRFSVGDAAMAARIGRRYDGWMVTRVRPLIAFKCFFSEKTGPGRSSIPRIIEQRNDRGHIVRRDFECRWNRGRGSITLHPSIYSFDALLRVVLSMVLPMRGGLLLHASAVAAGKRKGFIFAGRSGSGKTTMARLLGKTTILNDELCVVTINKKGARLYGTPFWGEMRTGAPHPESYPLRTIYFLEKAQTTARVVLDCAEAFRRLLATVCSFSSNAVITQGLLSVVERIILRIPAYELRFSRLSAEVSAVVLRSRNSNAP
jgi:hypothetical protein